MRTQPGGAAGQFSFAVVHGRGGAVVEQPCFPPRPPAGQFPHVEVNPFEPEVDWFTRDVEVMPLSAAPEPKRRFIPSKWEEKK